MRKVLVVVAILGLAGLASAAEPEVPSCIRYWGEARNTGYGYNHIVHFASACDVTTTAQCTTDVNPQPTRVLVPAKTEVSVNTFLGSPSSVFTPHAKCARTK